MTRKTMPHYRIESSFPIFGHFFPDSGSSSFFLNDWALAVVVAAKSFTRPLGQEIRVIFVPSGEVVYRKTTTDRAVSVED